MQPHRWTTAALTAGFLFLAPVAGAQTPAADGSLEQTLQALQSELAELRKGQQAIRQELQQIRRDMAKSVKPAAPSRPQADLSKVSLSFEGEPSKGDADTKLVLMDFFDYQ